jgi:dephospho-CoA kinase
MLVIGLVGGVACGKSFVASCFRELGAEILDADKIGHQVLEIPKVISDIRSRWPNVSMVEGKIDRTSLARIVFRDGEKDQLNWLESITHPLIEKEILNRIVEFRRRDTVAAVLDAPVMFKSGWNKICDRIVFIHTDLQTRIARSANRGWSADEVSKRELFQTPLNEKRNRSTNVVDNSQSKDETRKQIKQLWHAWKLGHDQGNNPS